MASKLYYASGKLGFSPQIPFKFIPSVIIKIPKLWSGEFVGAKGHIIVQLFIMVSWNSVSSLTILMGISIFSRKLLKNPITGEYQPLGIHAAIAALFPLFLNISLSLIKSSKNRKWRVFKIEYCREYEYLVFIIKTTSSFVNLLAHFAMSAGN